VLTGPGGGTWDIPIGQRQPSAPVQIVGVEIVTDAIGFCRLVANRLTPPELGAHITGDRGRADQVLTAASALALD